MITFAKMPPIKASLLISPDFSPSIQVTPLKYNSVTWPHQAVSEAEKCKSFSWEAACPAIIWGLVTKEEGENDYWGATRSLCLVLHLRYTSIGQELEAHVTM